VRLVDVLGGPDYEVSYPNGDRAAYVTAVYEARIIGGSSAPSDGELSELAWFTPAELPGLHLSGICRALLQATGRLDPRSDESGWPGTSLPVEQLAEGAINDRAED